MSALRSSLPDGTVILQAEARVDWDWQPLLVRLAPDRSFSVWLGAVQVGAGHWDGQEVRFAQGEQMPSQVRAFAAGMVREEIFCKRINAVRGLPLDWPMPTWLQPKAA